MSTSRPITPKLWTGLTLAGAALTFAGAGTAQGLMTPGHPPIDSRLWLAAGEETAPALGAPTLGAPAEGGEGGEAGAVAGVSADVAYLAQLSIVEGHMRAAADLYRQGMTDEAIGLSYHPEAEMMDEVRSRVAAHGAADFTPAMAAMSETMERGAPTAEVDTALAAVQAGIAAAAAPEAAELRTRFDAVVVVLRAAASEYASATEGGVVGDAMAWHEARSFVAVARDLAAALAADPATATPAAKALAAMAGADAAFGPGPQMIAADANILLGVAARVELIAGTVR